MDTAISGAAGICVGAGVHGTGKVIAKMANVIMRKYNFIGRLSRAEKVLKETDLLPEGGLNKAQREQILRAHMSKGGVNEKTRILKDFTKTQRRALMEGWVVGIPKTVTSMIDDILTTGYVRDKRYWNYITGLFDDVRPYSGRQPGPTVRGMRVYQGKLRSTGKREFFTVDFSETHPIEITLKNGKVVELTVPNHVDIQKMAKGKKGWSKYYIKEPIKWENIFPIVGE